MTSETLMATGHLTMMSPRQRSLHLPRRHLQCRHLPRRVPSRPVAAWETRPCSTLDIDGS